MAICLSYKSHIHDTKMPELVVRVEPGVTAATAVAAVAAAAIVAVAVIAACLLRAPAPAIVLVIVKSPTSNTGRRATMRATLAECQRILAARSSRCARLVYTYATSPSKLFNAPRATGALHRDTTAITQWVSDYLQRHPLAGLDSVVAAGGDCPLGWSVDGDEFLENAFGVDLDGSVDRPDLVDHYFKLRSSTPPIFVTVHDRPNCARQRHMPNKLRIAAAML
jgi:hypothetical protein